MHSTVSKIYLRALTITSSNAFISKYLLISLNISLLIPPKILKSILFIVNCNDCKSAEFVGHDASIPYSRYIGKHFDLINSKRTSSDALRPILPKMSLKAFFIENEHLNLTEAFQ